MEEEFSKKGLYQSPECNVIDLQVENGILAESTGERYNAPENWDGMESWS